ncbi:cupin domain-containing protein [Rhizobium sp. NXC24]|uniref:cupin domain-containing protein n=1 Tax=Rhizobium sp. NXC24 TaxID=2048897 RepID=UPI000CDF4D83|nr:cupin domain-containing protein [Rhizobium sp. NXC24]AVA26158.1 cupin 2 domain-containing protein [Rhizobium sp. NXC24]
MNKGADIRIPRRVVTGLKDGKSVFISDGPTPNAHRYDSVPGHLTSVVYATPARPSLPQDHAEQAPPKILITPEPGGTKLMIVVFPPDSVFATVDPVAAFEEQAVHVPGLIQAFEADAPGMHTTNTIDYDIVLDGEVWLELDDGAETLLKQGDIVVQCGTRHAWRNKSGKPATMCFVLIGAERE